MNAPVLVPVLVIAPPCMDTVPPPTVVAAVPVLLLFSVPPEPMTKAVVVDAAELTVAPDRLSVWAPSVLPPTL